MGGGLPGQAELVGHEDGVSGVGGCCVGLLFQDVVTVSSFSFTFEPIPEAGSVVVLSAAYS